MNAKRLFVAIDLPEPIARGLSELNPRLRGVRWLPPEQMHLTLGFLGNVGPIAEETLLERLGAIEFGAFFLPIVGIGSFPAKGRPNVIWAGVGAAHPHLFQLHKRVQEAALGAGLEPDLRSFHPHVTTARCKDVSAESIRPFLKANADLDLGMIRIETFSLYSSVPGPLGSAYTRELEVRATH
jgi:2'-5' RNA ligase